MVIVSRVPMRRLVPTTTRVVPLALLAALLPSCPRPDWTPASLRDPVAPSGTAPMVVGSTPPVTPAPAPAAQDYSRGVTVAVSALTPGAKGRIAFGVPFAP